MKMDSGHGMPPSYQMIEFTVHIQCCQPRGAFVSPVDFLRHPDLTSRALNIRDGGPVYPVLYNSVTSSAQIKISFLRLRSHGVEDHT